MKTKPGSYSRALGMLPALLLAAAASAGEPALTERIEPADIALGESASLTISVSGSTTTPIAPPAIPNLEFVAVGQSTQVESINGRTTSTSSVVYDVRPQRVGVYTFPAPIPGAQPLTLRVHAGSGRTSTATSGNNGTSALPPVAVSLPGGATRLSADGSAFVRLGLPTHQLYVGQSIPVNIQVGLREGLVASLNGPPTLNGDAFTLNKLSSNPDRAEEVIGGEPFTVLTWHSVLMAVKPGALSLAIETPLTVRMRVPTRPAADQFGDPVMDNLFNDPFFQNFFGQTTEKDISVASAPVSFSVLALPALNRPAGFNGAVGAFQIHSDLSANATTAGDPLTLRLHITGTGTFDRVSSPMLSNVDRWKTYQPTATFTPADTAGFRGDKVFEQAVIATQPGTQVLPGVPFSYFDPQAGRYETVRTPPYRVAVSPSAAGDGAGTAARPTAVAAANTASESTPAGLQPDHVEAGGSVNSLVPLYFQPWYLAVPSMLTLGFLGAWVGTRRRNLLSGTNLRALRRAAAAATELQLQRMDTAVRAGDAATFFVSARSALQQNLAARWEVPPGSVTCEMIDARLGAAGKEVNEVFALADQARFSGSGFDIADVQRFQGLVQHYLDPRMPP